ncbi:hypothetical protein [Priestia aryabhattai]
MFKLLDACLVVLGILFAICSGVNSPVNDISIWVILFCVFLIIAPISSFFHRKKELTVFRSISYGAIIYVFLEILFGVETLNIQQLITSILGVIALTVAKKFKTNAATGSLIGFWTYLFINLFSDKSINTILQVVNLSTGERVKCLLFMILMAISFSFLIERVFIKKRKTTKKNISSTKRSQPRKKKEQFKSNNIKNNGIYNK